NQYDGFQFSYANANRNYKHRFMATYNSGAIGKGWNVMLSFSKRYANTGGFYEGTPYDAYAYFAAVEKRFGLNHSLNLSVFGANVKRGKLAPTFMEMFDLAGTHTYNPNWGYQDGEYRNSRMVHQHLPMAVLAHEWRTNKNGNLRTSVGFLKGRVGQTGLDWYDSPDPRPDYYRNLPSFVLNDSLTSANMYELLSTSEDARQIDWLNMYEVNMSPTNIETHEGVNNNGDIMDLEGKRAKYILTDNREDDQRVLFSTIYNQTLSKKFALNMGLNGTFQNKHFFQTVDDLLGADFHINYNRFAERDNPANLDTVRQFDLQNPDRVVYEGDKYGYDYNVKANNQEFWAGAEMTTNHLDGFVTGKLSHTGYYREGNVQVGIFPENSLGKSETQNFINYGIKAGLTYKVNGRNFIFANGIYETHAPSYNNAFVSPRTRNEVAADLQSETHYGGELGYVLRSDRLFINAVGYYFKLNDITQTTSFYHDQRFSFVNYTLTGIDREHMGLELAARAKITDWFSVQSVLGLGQHIYTSRPTAITTEDNSAEVFEDGLVFMKNFHVANSPELTSTSKLIFRHKGFFAELGFNWVDRNWISINPNRRTSETLNLIEEEDIDKFTTQEMYDGQFSMDFFGGYTWRISYDRALVFNLGINNITNNRDFVAIGFENNRFGLNDNGENRFDNKYFFGQGINYFANITYRF
ncbi:MAG: hypothetical protein ACPG4Z_08095, partial [Chitinophagales bacterium]